MPTNLSPNHLCQSTDKLWSGIPIAPQGLLIYHFADCEPECCFETLSMSVSM